MFYVCSLVENRKSVGSCTRSVRKHKTICMYTVCMDINLYLCMFEYFYEQSAACTIFFVQVEYREHLKIN